jgi:prepilin-type N-terminal cleavage/methylation domain-containing protein
VREMKDILHKESGLTLIEVLVALSILSVVSVTFAVSMFTGYKGLGVSEDHTIAESLARTQLEAINNEPYDFTAPYQYTKIIIPTEYQGFYDIATPIAGTLIDPITGGVSGIDLGMQKVIVTVTKNGVQILQVQSYKR